MKFISQKVKISFYIFRTILSLSKFSFYFHSQIDPIRLEFFPPFSPYIEHFRSPAITFIVHILHKRETDSFENFYKIRVQPFTYVYPSCIRSTSANKFCFSSISQDPSFVAALQFDCEVDGRWYFHIHSKLSCNPSS